MYQIEINPEIVRLAQSRSRSTGVTLADDLARTIAAETVLNLDAEAGYLLDEDVAYSSNDSLVAAFGVNDIVVNGCRLDVRVVDEEGRVSVDRALITTSYLSSGTLVVAMQGLLSGRVVGHISAADWQAIDENAGDQQTVYLRAKVDGKFSLEQALPKLIAAQKQIASAGKAPESFELGTFVANRNQLIQARQRQIVELTLANPESWTALQKVVELWSRASVRKVLTNASLWNQRVEKVTNVLAPKFAKLHREDVKRIVERLGETFGGQPESAEFRKVMMVTLMREELSHSLGGAILNKATSIAEAVLSGRALSDAMADFAKNRVAVDLALEIKKQRQRVSGFMDASTGELSNAFAQLALQPVYSTHSQDAQAGIEAINEALKMITAGDLANQLKDVEDELANI